MINNYVLNALMALDSRLDSLVFGKPMGLFGEKATDEELKSILANFLGVEEEEEDYVEEEELSEVELNELAEEYVDASVSPMEAFKIGYRYAKREEE